MLARLFLLLAVAPACRTGLEADYLEGDTEDSRSYDSYDDEIRSHTTTQTVMEGRNRLKRWRMMGDYWTIHQETVVDVKGVLTSVLQGDKPDPLRVTQNPHQHTDSYVYVEKTIDVTVEHTTDQRRQFQQWLSTLAAFTEGTGDEKQDSTITAPTWNLDDQSDKNDILAVQRPIRAGVVPKGSPVEEQTTTEDPNNYNQETTTYNPSEMQAKVRQLVQHWGANNITMDFQETTKYDPSEMEAEVRKLVKHWSPSSMEKSSHGNAGKPAGVRQVVQHWSRSSVQNLGFSSSLQRPTPTSKVGQKNNAIMKIKQQRTGKQPEAKLRPLYVPTINIRQGSPTNSVRLKVLGADQHQPLHPKPYSPVQGLSSPSNIQLVSQTMDLRQWNLLSAEYDQAINTIDVDGVQTTANKYLLRQEPDEPTSESGETTTGEETAQTPIEEPTGSADTISNGDTSESVDTISNGDASGSVDTTSNGDASGSMDTISNGDTSGSVDTISNGDAPGSVDTTSNGDTSGSVDTISNGDTSGSVDTISNGDTSAAVYTTSNGDTSTSEDTTSNGATSGPANITSKSFDVIFEAGSADTSSNGATSGSADTTSNGTTSGSAGTTSNVTTSGSASTTSNGATNSTTNGATSAMTPDTTLEEMTGLVTTTTTQRPDIDAIMAIIANLTYDYEWNLTEMFNKSLIDHGVPTCPWKGGGKWGPGGIWTASTVNTTALPYDFENASVVSKCFVCGLTDTDIPRDAHCADAFAGDFLPLMPIDARSRGKIAGFRKYCRYIDTQNYVENPSEPKAIYGRFTGGCAVRWTDLTGVYTQRTCRAKYRPLLGKHFASKRMAKLELALVNVEVGCIISPMATLLPVSRGISLYARFHACVCKTNWCNRAIKTEASTVTIITIVLAHWLVHIWPL